MPPKDYNNLSSPQLHTANERNRRKWNRADAASRDPDPWGRTFTETGNDAPKEYWTNKRDARAREYDESRAAIKKRGEAESRYTTATKDSFIGAMKPLHKPVGESVCVMM